MPGKKTADLRENGQGTLEKFIKNTVRESQENRLSLIDGSPIFEEPLVGVADGDDPLFTEYKKIIGPFHFTPREMLERSLALTGGVRRDIKDISVICWALPIAKRTQVTNAHRDEWPSLRWAHTRYYGEKFNESLRQQLVSLLTGQGHLAVAPMLSPLWKLLPNYPGGPTSNWSERHALYVAGMGSFGLSDGFITTKGVAMRCGSVITNMKLPATPRLCVSHTDNCLFYINRSCGVCIDRCPAGAITAKGHNKVQCFDYAHKHLEHLYKRYAVENFGCGLCQTGVPCESGIPAKAKRKNYPDRKADNVRL